MESGEEKRKQVAVDDGDCDGCLPLSDTISVLEETGTHGRHVVNRGQVRDNTNMLRCVTRRWGGEDSSKQYSWGEGGTTSVSDEPGGGYNMHQTLLMRRRNLKGITLRFVSCSSNIIICTDSLTTTSCQTEKIA